MIGEAFAFCATHGSNGAILIVVAECNAVLVSARLPLAFGMFTGKINKLDKKLQLSPETAFLIREHVARINVCISCIDIGSLAAIKESMTEAKFDALEQYGTSQLFTDAERTALDYVTELTKDKKVNPDIFARMSRFYSERQICEIVWLVASEHFYNVTNIGLNHPFGHALRHQPEIASKMMTLVAGERPWTICASHLRSANCGRDQFSEDGRHRRADSN